MPDMDSKEASMSQGAAKGDRISVDSQKAGQAPRQGKVLEVLRRDYGTSYRVRWDDGHESTIRPTAGTVHTLAIGLSRAVPGRERLGAT
jgi:hypothetical protein